MPRIGIAGAGSISADRAVLSRKLFRSTATVGGNTFLSRILGFIRDIVIARLFGASIYADAFFVAFRIPNFLRRLFAEGAFSQAFVPVLSEYKTQHSADEVRDLTACTAGALGAVLLLVTAIGIVAAPVLVTVFAPGFLGDDTKFDLTVQMLRITFPYLLFISLTALAGGVLNTYGRFGVPAFTPVLLNLALISAAIWLAPRLEQPVIALAWGVFAGGVVQLAFQLPFLKRIGLLVWPRLRRGHEGVRKVVRLMIPALFGASVSQINLLVDTLIASFLVTGSVSWLYYSDRLVEFPLGVFGVALGTVILPSLSQKHAQGAAEEFSNTLDWALRWVLIIALPATVGLAILAGPMLTTLFQYGEFSPADVRMARLSLVAYSLGLMGFASIKVLAPGFFSRQDTRTPVRIGVIAMVANIVLNLILVVPLAHAGLALATSLSAFLNAGLLYRALRKHGVHRPSPGWAGFIVRVLIANGVMGIAIAIGVGDLALWLQADVAYRVIRLAALVFGGVAVYFLALAICGVRVSTLIKPAGT
ncbi:MAG: murein biosynthesis integral membrane protein MurJ [Gammaproteobacteria bacterium]|nr:MAG: murein biosynthesis integral membrane protein MurJ [Gammaproteobacteria bacterium]